MPRASATWFSFDRRASAGGDPSPATACGAHDRRTPVDVRDLFLDQHAAMHSAAVGGNKMSASERAFTGLTDEQMRVRPREDLNSLAWLMFHISRAEDIFVNTILGARTQLFDDESWAKRLAITRRDFGIGMTSAEVTELTRQIELGALREYRDAVGRRTRDVVGRLQVAGLGGHGGGRRRPARGQ